MRQPDQYMVQLPVPEFSLTVKPAELLFDGRRQPRSPSGQAAIASGFTKELSIIIIREDG